MKTIETHGIAIPKLGFGTYRMPGDDCRPIVESALALGYRHIDTAAMYENEYAVGAAIAASGVPRNELFVTTKAWRDDLATRDSILSAFDASLSKLKLNHVDLYMIHWPSSDMNMGTVMSTLADLLGAGHTRSIGVCNFNIRMMRSAVEEIRAPIASLQIEYHPFLDQSPMLAYARAKGIAVTAHAPLAQGRAANDETLRRIGRKYDASAAQVAIAWLLNQESVAAIPKAKSVENQRKNLDALQIVLDEDDRHAISNLPKDQRYVQPPFAPDWTAT